MTSRYVRIKKFCELTGYTAAAIYNKISDGAWTEGQQYVRAPDNRPLVDMEGYERWASGGQAAGSSPLKLASG